MPTKMNAAFKKKWVAALRSGKFRQGYGTLCIPPGKKTDRGGRTKTTRHCCLGVACAIAPKSWGIKWEPDASWLPLELQKRIGLDSVSPLVRYLGQLQRLASINDDGVSFSVIADLIEEQL